MTLQKKTARMRGIAVALLAALGCSCVSQNIPTHGGGKRFFVEQALLTKAADSAIGQLDLSRAAKAQSSPVELYVIAMGDEGGGSGIDTGSGLFGIGGLFLPSEVNDFPSSASTGSNSFGSHAFANARDIEYLRGKILQSLYANGVMVTGSRGKAKGEAPKIYILVSELGTSKEGFDLLVYNEEKLSARVALEGFMVTEAKGSVGNEAPSYVPLGSGECTTEYLARYLFGAGPLLGAQITVSPGAIPVRVVGPDGSPLNEGQGN